MVFNCYLASGLHGWFAAVLEPERDLFAVRPWYFCFSHSVKLQEFQKRTPFAGMGHVPIVPLTCTIESSTNVWFFSLTCWQPGLKRKSQWPIMIWQWRKIIIIVCHRRWIFFIRSRSCNGLEFSWVGGFGHGIPFGLGWHYPRAQAEEVQETCEVNDQED